MATQESPEECAFRQHSAALLHAIDSPDELAWQLYSSDIISSSVKSKALVRELSKEEKNSILLSAVEGRIRANPAVFHMFVEFLLVSDDSLLRGYGGVLQNQLQKTSSVCRSTLSTAPLDIFQLIPSESTHSVQCTSKQHETVIQLYSEYLRSVYSTLEPPYCKWPPTQSTCYINLAAICKENPSGERHTRSTIRLHGEVDRVLETKKPIKIEEILSTGSDRKPRCVLVEGAPGVGKTTFCWEVCKRWGKGELFQEYSIVVLLSLREAWVQRATSVSDLFYYPVEEVQREIFREIVNSRGENTLIVLDGLDELPRNHQVRSTAVLQLFSGIALPLATVLATSRPSLAEWSWRCYISQRVEVLGFTKQNVQDYAQSILPSDLLPGFTEYLSIHPGIHTMMYVPLNCAVIVEVYRHNRQSDKLAPNTATQLYTDLTHTLLLRYLLNHPDYIDQDLLLTNTYSDLPPPVLACFRKVCAIAYKGILEGQLVFSDLGQSFDHLGFMQPVNELFGPSGRSVSYSFLHLSIQEYLAAVCTSQMGPQQQLTLFEDHYRGNELQGVWRFVFGLTGLKGFDLSVVQDCLCPSWCGRRQIDSQTAELLFEAHDPKLLSILGRDTINCRLWELTPSTSVALAYCILHSECVWTLEFLSQHLDSNAAEILDRAMAGYGPSCPGYVDTIKGEISPQYLKMVPLCILQGIKVLCLKKDYTRLAGANQGSLAEVLSSMTSLEEFHLQGDLLRVTQAGPESPKRSSPTAQIANLCTSLSGLNAFKRFHLGGYSVKAADGVALKQLLQSTSSLELLDLSKSYIPSETILPISEGLCSNATLKKLSLKHSNFDKRSAEAFGFMLTVNRSLTTLDISTCKMDDESVQCLAQALHHNGTVKDLDISFNPFGDTGAVAIARMLERNASLEQLRLIDGREPFALAPTLTHTGVKELVQSLLVNKCLAKLKLSNHHEDYVESLRTYRRVKHRIELSRSDY